mmetsp:Transcript_45439/g.141154  ORF Transcript_45439/g.141154 Transcript_45439/m.141154 type:complete len:362 (+) Transcript_45439:2355-3440(+)
MQPHVAPPRLSRKASSMRQMPWEPPRTEPQLSNWRTSEASTSSGAQRPPHLSSSAVFARCASANARAAGCRDRHRARGSPRRRQPAQERTCNAEAASTSALASSAKSCAGSGGSCGRTCTPRGAGAVASSQSAGIPITARGCSPSSLLRGVRSLTCARSSPSSPAVAHGSCTTSAPGWEPASSPPKTLSKTPVRAGSSASACTRRLVCARDCCASVKRSDVGASGGGLPWKAPARRQSAREHEEMWRDSDLIAFSSWRPSGVVVKVPTSSILPMCNESSKISPSTAASSGATLSKSKTSWAAPARPLCTSEASRGRSTAPSSAARSCRDRTFLLARRSTSQAQRHCRDSSDGTANGGTAAR